MDFSIFGLSELTGLALHDFQNKLDGNEDLTYEYLVAKLGFDISDPA